VIAVTSICLNSAQFQEFTAPFISNVSHRVIPVDADGFTCCRTIRYALNRTLENTRRRRKAVDTAAGIRKAGAEGRNRTRSQSWEQILEMHLSNSVPTNADRFILATGLRRTSSPDEEEVLAIRKVSEGTRHGGRSEITDAVPCGHF